VQRYRTASKVASIQTQFHGCTVFAGDRVGRGKNGYYLLGGRIQLGSARTVVTSRKASFGPSIQRNADVGTV
jgi:hypothetical protein